MQYVVRQGKSTELKKRCFGGLLCNAFITLRLRFLKFGGLSFARNQYFLSIHSSSEKGRQPVKKIPAYATLPLTMKVEVQSLLNRIIISYNQTAISEARTA